MHWPGAPLRDITFSRLYAAVDDHFEEERPLRAEEPLGQSAKVVFRWPHANAHEYKKGDLLIIDDRASLHKAGFDYDHSQHRRLYRMLVRGDRPC
jgi:alpha-ketoglutarate-dependent taurine dioxygenase